MNPFQIEKIRAKLAKQNKYKNLRSYYHKKYKTIDDINTSTFWDKLNSECIDYLTNNNPMAHERVQIIAKIIKGDNIKVLNIGFGSASLEDVYFKTKLRERENIEWVGVDISNYSVKLATDMFHHAQFKVGSIMNLNFKQNYFDYVIASEILEHIKPHLLFKAIKQIYKVLKKTGSLIVSVPLNEKLEHLVNEGKNPNGHVRVYTPELIKAEMKIAGFSIVNEQYLYAFKNNYLIKKHFIKLFNIKHSEPNNIILLAKKCRYE